MYMHSPHDIKLPAGTVYLSFKTTVDDTEWSDSKRVQVLAGFEDIVSH